MLSNTLGKMLRESGQALDRVGLTVANTEIFRETLSRHRPIMSVLSQKPLVAKGVFVAPSATVVGQVYLHGESSIWYGAVVRGDQHKINVGTFSNIQDRAIVSTMNTECKIGDYVTIGHGAMLTSCTIGDHCLIGQGAIIQEQCVVEKLSIIAAGAVVLPETIIPSGQMWAGNPAVFVRNVTDAEKTEMDRSAKAYATLSKEHATEFASYDNEYQQAGQL